MTIVVATDALLSPVLGVYAASSPAVPTAMVYLPLLLLVSDTLASAITTQKRLRSNKSKFFFIFDYYTLSIFMKSNYRSILIYHHHFWRRKDR
jgi:hypothetical protein